ncbi:pyridoxamine 5'-phosphate oxidase family protein [Streptomyces sp. A3M-1-3]|uniref:pyridoxamine 5'-phosphate oxidase family protein n=1 Tax=Streptomyces sp. A3M-1-3 TaxID=2962044 RepID=UPI0020B7A276|nr:pyridoxamine 5'-phosphate oxidase family protein [Streptomyces sp. A3M-1-3]MCP3817848.1 pyridoxamine 5'-phosphate oxidase family protein [Streptomyces sp. A3M-1-3]
MPTELDSLIDRTRRLLCNARYLSLATVSPEDGPWVATLEYAWFDGPLRFVYGSATGSRHSRDLAASPRVGGSLFLTGGGAGLDVEAIDGAQFAGRCSEISGADLDHYHPLFYEAVFPDTRERAEWMLPKAALQDGADHRLYLIEVERWWLIDTRTWEQDRIDRRIEVALENMTSGVESGT